MKPELACEPVPPGIKGEKGDSAKVDKILEDIKSMQKQTDEMRCNCK